jgi:ferredoxin-thioredoxin reductase catalytic subunit
MTAEQLYEMLRKVQEPKGYFFNREREKVFDLLEGLLINRERYGYMSCPCRLASGNRDWDRDIICPCIYREEDLRAYGRCY